LTIRKGLPAKDALTDADDTRYLFSGLVVCNEDGSPRGGVLSPVGVNLVTSSATMNVSVARFQGAAVRDAGIVLLANDGAVNVTLDAAPSANSRIDVIYAKQNDASGTVTAPDGNDTAVLTFVKGTAGASPVKPSLPVGALELATVLLPSTATATNSAGVVITQTADFSAATGGVVSFRTKVDLDLWTTAITETQAVVLADGIGYTKKASAWVLAQPRIVLTSGVTGTSGTGSVGSPPSGYVSQIRAGRVAATTGGAGVLPAYTFGEAFPNGITSIALTAHSGAAANPVLDGGKVNQNGFTAIAVGTSSGTAMVYSFTAFGW